MSKIQAGNMGSAVARAFVDCHSPKLGTSLSSWDSPTCQLVAELIATAADNGDTFVISSGAFMRSSSKDELRMKSILFSVCNEYITTSTVKPMTKKIGGVCQVDPRVLRCKVFDKDGLRTAMVNDEYDQYTSRLLLYFVMSQAVRTVGRKGRGRFVVLCDVVSIYTVVRRSEFQPLCVLQRQKE
jgi:hypothetical protein